MAVKIDIGSLLDQEVSGKAKPALHLWLRGASGANLYLFSLWIFHTVCLSRVWNQGCVVCIGASVAMVCFLHLNETFSAFLSPALGVIVSAMQAVLAIAVALAVVIDRLVAMHRGRLSMHLVVFFLSNPDYILTYCSAHFGWFFLPTLIVGILLLLGAWDCLRRWACRLPATRIVIITGVIGGLVASFAFPGLPMNAGDQQATFAGDILTESLRPARGAADLGNNSLTILNTTAATPRGNPGHPHIVMFHLEGARPDILSNSTTPFLSDLLNKQQGSLHPIFATIPMTLKSAWELLCGSVPSLSSDFREHQHEELRAFCLPRILRGLGYRTLCAKTDMGFPQIPLQVFGFDEVIAEEDPRRLIDRVDHWLASHGTDGQLVFIYFYYSGSHSPFTLKHLQALDQYTEPIQQFHENPTRNIYANMVYRGDRCVEHLNAVLKARAICTNNSIWLTFGDHSESLQGDITKVRASSVGVDYIRTFVLAQFPIWMRPTPHAEGPRRFGDLYATILEGVGLIVAGPIFFGISICKPVPATRPVFSYVFLDNSRCAKRQLGVTQMLHSKGVDLFNTLSDPNERLPLRVRAMGVDTALADECFENLYKVNDHYRHWIPNIRPHSRVQPKSLTRLHVWSAMDELVSLFSIEVDGTKELKSVLEPHSDVVFVDALGQWVAYAGMNQVQQFNALDSTVIIHFYPHVPTALSLSCQGTSSPPHPT